MPSGAKKRKAAKKKKENPSSSNPPSHSHGVNDEGNEEQKAVVEESVVLVQRESKPGKELVAKDVDSENDEHPRKSGSSSSSSNSSRSSSDDESHVVEKIKAFMDNVTVPDLAKPSDALPEQPVEVTHSGDSVIQASPAVDLEKAPLLEEKVEVNTNASDGTTMVSYDDKHEEKENGEEGSSSAEEKVGSVASVVDVVPVRKEEEAIVQSVEGATATSDTKECAAQEVNENASPQSNKYQGDSETGARQEQDPEIIEPVASTSSPVQTTSWKSCCGLFEVLTGSSR